MPSLESFKLTDNSKVRYRREHKNTFSLTQGLPKDGGSCVHATKACLKVCYDATLRRIYKHYRANEDYNYALVKDATQKTMHEIISNTLDKWFFAEGKKDPYFRIHTGGEFFNKRYTNAWRDNISARPHIQFWAYSRSMFVVPILEKLSNLTLMLSCDVDNKEEVLETYKKYSHRPNIAVAWMGDARPENFPSDRSTLLCPEVTGKTKNINKQGACSRCRVCIDRRLKTGQIRHVQFPIHK